MAAVPSQKCLREVSSEQAAQLEDDVVHAEKHDYTKVLNAVEAHGKEPLPDWVDRFLKERMYTFVDFYITRDKLMLKNSGLEINPENFIDMQKKWRHPYIDKPYDSLADVASMVVHLFYKHMKQKINRNEDHKLWGIAPLPDHLIQYAAIDAYATYKVWTAIDIVIKGFYRLNYDEKFGTVYDY
ncbi:hypothetical protein D1007_56992 [Hordeum vulgare]|nr:hypothetical protein D1007_56992 [Hordeum vulgare]